MKATIIFIAILLFNSCLVYAQHHANECEFEYNELLKKNVYHTVENYPNYPSGLNKFLDKFYKRINYDKLILTPEEAFYQDRVLVTLIIDNDGAIVHSYIESKDEKDYLLVDREVMRVIKLMDCKWIPGKCKGEAVATKFSLLFRFDYK